MEPVTHILTGACLARTGLNKRAAYATVTMMIAAEFPDIDTLWELRGPVAGFQHHRGITHTFLGLPFEAAVIVAAVYGVHRWRVARAARAQRQPSTQTDDDHIRIERPLTAAPVRWGLLYTFALLALLSHLLLDYTNNYGIRPFFPFNPHWYAASIVFIFDPLIFTLLLGALVMPALLGLVQREVSGRRQPFRGRGWAITALLAIIVLWSFRAVEHSRAVDIAMQQSAQVPAPLPEAASTSADAPAPPDAAPTYLAVERTLASPDPLNPFRWYAALDFGPFYQLATIDTRMQQPVTNDGVTYPRPDRTPAVLAAMASPLGRAYMDWSPMPFVSQVPASQPGVTAIIFRDPRFMGNIPFLPETGRTALTATVQIDAQGHIVRQTMDGRSQP
jgi:inner membrane protein